MEMSKRQQWFITIELFVVMVLVLILGSVMYNTKAERYQNVDPQVPIEDMSKKYEEKKLTYAALGDSLTKGYYATNKQDRFVSLYSEMLKLKLGYTVKLEESSDYGWTTKKGLNEAEKLAKAKPDVVTLTFGTSDINPSRNISLTQYKSNYKKIVDVFVKGNPKVKIYALTSWNQADSSDTIDDALKSALKNDKNTTVVNLKPIWSSKANISKEGAKTFSGKSDDFHPNDVGMKNIANAVLKASEKDLSVDK